VAKDCLRFGILAFWGCLSTIVLLPPVEGAQPYVPGEVSGRQIVNTPVYNRGTKSYFELVVGAKCHCTWGEAYTYAQRLEYKGVRGRLAPVENAEVHEFLMRTFKPQYQTWIGIRYLCKGRAVQYSTGKLMSRGDFSAWEAQWNQSGPKACDKSYNVAQYLGVAYSPISEGFRWFAKESHKYYQQFFVEFPTGHP